MSQSGNIFTIFNSEETNDADIIYCDLQIINNGNQADPTQVDNPNPAIIFSQTRDTPIVNDCSKYQFSIIRFSMNGVGKALPIFIPCIRTGSLNPLNDVNLTSYDVGLSVSVSYTVGGKTATNTFTVSQPIIYEPEILDQVIAPVPPASSCQTGQTLNTQYYWVMTVSHWVNLTNKAYQIAWSVLNAFFKTWYAQQFQVLPENTPDLTTEPPRISFNPTTNLFNIWADRYGFGDNQITTTNPQRTSVGSNADENFSMYMDANLFGMYSNFDSLYVNQLNNLTYKILISNVANLYNNILTVSSPPAPTAKSYWYMTQDAPSTSTLWSPVDSIVFTSGTLPLLFENVSAPTRFGDGNVDKLTTTNSNFAPIITDIQLASDTAFDYRGYIQYSPSAEYRMLAFQRSKVPLNQIDIQVLYKNRLDGNLYPLYMYNLASVSIKIMLRRRGINTYPHPSLTKYEQF